MAAAPTYWTGVALASVLGLLWAVAVYALAHLVARGLGQPPLTAAAPGARTNRASA